MTTTIVSRPLSEAATSLVANGWVTDRRHASSRPLWRARFHLAHEGGILRMERRFIGVGPEPVSTEVAYWSASDKRCVSVSATQPHLHETCRATIAPQHIDYMLERGTEQRSRSESVNYPVLPVSAMPLFCASQAPALLSGAILKARYPVLKVMRSATVTLKRIASDQPLTIAVTPVNPLLRLIFGSTFFHFTSDLSALTGFDGLLDPRDRKPNGRWFEYLGRISLEKPLPLTLDHMP